MGRSRILRILGAAVALVLFWSIPALMVSLQFALDMQISGETKWTVWRIFAFNWPRWLIWVPLTPAIAWVASRFLLERPHLARRLAVHAGALLATLAVVTFVWTWRGRQSEMNSRFTTWQLATVFFPACVNWTIMGYAGVAGITTAVLQNRRAQRATLTAAQLERQLAQARLDALRRQLQPHFFFNTLHAISGLVRTSRGPEAIAMVARLSELLRETLAETGPEEVPLAREIELLELYLEIQKIRFSDRLEIRMRVAPETLPARVPVMLLQPLAENALEHGIAPRSGGGWLAVETARRGDSLEIALRNNGVPLGATRTSGVGLRNAAERLQQLYGGNARLDLRNEEGGIVAARITLPWSNGAGA